jgi:small subunit ribosomal protein S6
MGRVMSASRIVLESVLLHFQPEVISTLRRTAGAIFNKGGIIRKLENLGTRNLPYKMSAHGSVHRQGR